MLEVGFVSFSHQNGRNRSDSDSLQQCLQGLPPDLHLRKDAVPKILDVDEIDFESEEWKEMRDILDGEDPNNHRDPIMDEQVLGSLFKLGEKNN